MNCFQKFVSLIFWATIRRNRLSRLSCELLSKVCIFDILSNRKSNMHRKTLVVNCFQKFVSLIFWATNFDKVKETIKLWIAFKSLYLWYSEQLEKIKEKQELGCELLSKVCIFDILSNSILFEKPKIVLWIAFKSLYLWYSEQQLFHTI